MSELNRRGFLGSAVVGTAALSLSAKTYGNVMGSNDRIGVAFVGVGGRCQAHIGHILKMQKENKGVAPVGVCDVWDGFQGTYTDANGKQTKYSQGLFPSAKRCGLDPADKKHVAKDYHTLLDNKDVDVICIAAPDHWHAKLSIDALTAGKDVYCEKPMTRTIDEAHAVVDAAKKYNRVMSVGVQSMANPVWRNANEYIKAGKIGHVAQAQTSYYRNSSMGQWRYYPLFKEMNPTTVNWEMFLGHKFDVNGVPLGPRPDQAPFDRAVFAQWRCYWPFGGGMFTDLFVHQTTHMIAAMGVRYPARVVGGGGIYVEYDERDVPDVATVVADYDEGCQLIVTATMINDYGIDEVIRGRLATLKFTRKNGEMGFDVLPQNLGGGPAIPKQKSEEGGQFVSGGFKDLNDADTYALWEDFLNCVRAKKRETLSTPELGAAAFTTVNLGVQSYRTGQVMFWNKELRKPVEGNGSWAGMWEKLSKAHGKVNQIIGWEGGDAGSLLYPLEYQKLGGPWMNGKDPAGA